MASTTSTMNNISDRNHSKSTLTWANEEDDTEMAGTNRGKIDQKEDEFLVKWQLPGNLDVATAKKQITTLLGELMASFTDVTFIDNKKREWKFNENDDYEKFLKEVASATVQVHPTKTQQQKIIRWITVTKIRAASRISDWKNNDYFYDQVLESKAYMFPHPFQYEEWDITSIGFLKSIHTTHITPEYLHDMILEYIHQHETTPPTFQLIPQKISNKERNATTRAYTVQCAKTDAKRMIDLLTKGEFRSTQMFIPFRYKRNQPDLFTTCIKQQNEVYYKTWVVKVEGISKEVMHFLMGEIHSMKGVYHIVPTRKIQQSGEWKILVDQTQSPFIHRQLNDNWKKLMSNVPQNFLEQAPPSWPAPRISSQKIREYQDDSSNDSYGTLLTSGTNDSVLTYGEDILQDLPEAYRFPSYAAAAAPPASTVTATTFSSPTASDSSEWQKEKADLEAMIQRQAAMLEKLQIEQSKMIREMQTAHTQLIHQLKIDQINQIDKIQADIDAKVSTSKDLQDQLAQALEMAYKRNTREDELLNKFEELMKYFPTGDVPKHMDTSISQNTQLTLYEKPHTTPPRNNTSKESPPPKKANTNSSPQRNIYNIFKPHTGRTHRSSQKQVTTPPRMLTQPMEEDYEVPQPTPMADSGKHKE